MFASIKNIISPKSVQAINGAIYDYVKISIFMTLYSLPWTIVNLVFKFSEKTYIFYALAFLFVVPNLVTLLQVFDKENISFKDYSALLRAGYQKKFLLGVVLVAVISFCLTDTYILMELMQLNWLFPLLYISLMFIVVASIYSLLFFQTETSWQEVIKKAVFFSWRYSFRTLCIFLLLMLWLSIGYFLQGLNFIFGNALFWGIIYRLASKKIN
ncbi:putative membrane protein YesL [Enterococcus sp. PF1-24]|uniref:hypothetical protein n=1 Tax=unclassified Enterococcus TaxID=2608891 RepID=UPI002475DEC5|nr:MULTISPECIES: hypothetical protein [unclassified Enterococcus]MDH6363993.1 putative membrane protein YesL [Enterococcus sp. PFB1-1]MDH6401094.1 putative membrane protein YesL [Enterococcus sp. PF1-24]